MRLYVFILCILNRRIPRSSNKTFHYLKNFQKNQMTVTPYFQNGNASKRTPLIKSFTVLHNPKCIFSPERIEISFKKFSKNSEDRFAKLFHSLKCNFIIKNILTNYIFFLRIIIFSSSSQLFDHRHITVIIFISHALKRENWFQISSLDDDLSIMKVSKFLDR